MGRTIGFGPVVFLVSVAVLSVGCQPTPPPPPPVESLPHVDVYIHHTPGQQPVYRAVKVEGYPTVLEVTRGVAQVHTETTPEGDEWVVGIDRVMNNIQAGRVWVYEVNTSAGTRAPNLQHVKPGDVIRWRLP